MSLWLMIGIPLLFLLGLFMNAIKDMKRLEKELPKYKDKIRKIPNDDEEQKK
jgi:hypothetical protein